MHACTCGNREVMVQMFPKGASLGQIFCENFERCPEEERTGVRNDAWMEFLRAQEQRPAPKRPEETTAPLTSGLIYLKAVQQEVTQRRDSQLLEAVRPPSIPIPAVLVPRQAERPISSWTWLLGAVAVLSGAAVVGTQVYREVKEDGEAMRSAPPESRGAALPVLAPPAGERAVAPEMETAPVLLRPPEPSAPRALAVAPVERDGKAERRAERRKRKHHRRHARDAKPVDRDADVDVNPLPKDPSYSLHDALAKVTGAERAPVGTASAATPAPAPGAVSAGGGPELSLPGASAVSRDPQVARGVDALLKQAAAPAAGTAEAPTLLAPVLPRKLSAAQVSRFSGRLVHRVRRCASTFGFAKLTIQARARLTGATGSVEHLSLAGRFAGSPLEQCSRRAMGALRTPRFQDDRQTLSIPVVLP